MPDPIPTPPTDPDAPSAVQEAQAAEAVVRADAELAREAHLRQLGTTGWIVRNQGVLVITIALVVSMLIGALLIRAQGFDPWYAYKELFLNALGSGSGLMRTLEKTTPLVLAGLAVVLPLRVGLFNIGGQGQLLIAGAMAAWAGYALPNILGLSWLIAALVGILAGALWAAIAGALKTYRGVHEVISTIMLNEIAGGIIWYLVTGPVQEHNNSGIPQTPEIAERARLGSVGGIPLGFFIAVGLALLAAWMFRRTTLGFRFDTVGKNQHAAGYAGINRQRIILLSMVMAGAFAGLAGALEVTGVTHRFDPALGGTIGFDGITIALLARSKPLGTIPAAFLVGTLRSGAPGLQFATGIAPEIVDLLLAITLLLVSIPIIGKWIFENRWARRIQVATSGGAA